MMSLTIYLFVGAIVVINISEINGHGMLMDPVNRGSAYKKGFPTKPNWDDNGNNCGGHSTRFEQSGGKCGVCGDNYAAKQPRKNENGGLYGEGVIVKKYEAGSIITAVVKLTKNHGGNFSFALCPLKDKNDVETDECFDKHKIELSNGDKSYKLTTSKNGNFEIELRLPKDLKCEHCSLRWQYIAANNWGKCKGGNREAIGCGNQEMFRTCSDITIE